MDKFIKLPGHVRKSRSLGWVAEAFGRQGSGKTKEVALADLTEKLSPHSEEGRLTVRYGPDGIAWVLQVTHNGPWYTIARNGRHSSCGLQKELSHDSALAKMEEHMAQFYETATETPT